MNTPPAPVRLGYLDWLRGVTVLVMMEAHAFDSWTRPDEKARAVYGYLMILGGMAAPAFLFMAGIAVALAVTAHMRRGHTHVDAARRVERRGWQIFLYAFLFRLQSFVLGGFANPSGFLKVDILNVMGPAIALTASAWRWSARRWTLVLVLAPLAIAIAVVTPAIREAAWVTRLPDPVEWYLVPPPGRGWFTFFPWAGFVVAGAVVGLAIDGARAWSPWRLHLLIASAGIALAASAYWASWQPPLFPTARFWTTSPTFFALRVGVLVTAVALAWLWSIRPWPRLLAASPLQVLGVGSLFVYWVHVELVYGGATHLLRRRLSVEQAAIAWCVFTALMYLLLLGWNRLAPARAQLRQSLPTRLLSVN